MDQNRPSLSELLSEQLGFSEQDKADLKDRESTWDREFAPFEKALKQSQIITAADMRIRVGPC